MVNKELLKQKFYERYKVFFDTKVLNEIYSTDDFSICNISDQCYGVFPYIETEYGHYGVLVLPRIAEEIARNNNVFTTLLNSMDEISFKNRMVALNDKTFKKLYEIQKINQVKGASPDIDYEMEQRLMAKNKIR